jgi:hypothetical protein
MQQQLAYLFPTTQQASRVYHILKNDGVGFMSVRFHPDNYTVLATYRIEQTEGFDKTSSMLDELAELHGGSEISVVS